MSTLAATNLKHASSASNNIVLDSSGNATFAGTAVPSSSFLRNRIINGDMRIDQRNAGAEINPAVSGIYYVDRWFANSSAVSKFKIGQNAGAVTPPAGFPNYLGLTSLSAYTVGAGEYFGVTQIIEGFNVADLAWGSASARSVTLSFWVRSSLTGTFGGSLANSGYSRSYPFTYSISAANTWEYKTITVPGDTSGTWLTTNGAGLILTMSIGSGSTLSGPAGAWASATYTSATGAVSVVGTNGATFYLTGVQLEVGTAATPFERRQYGQELVLCQRYYETGYNIWSGYVNGVSQYYFATNYKVTKRAAATLSFSSISGSGFPSTAPSVGENQPGYFRTDPISNASSTAAYYQFLWAASAEL